MPAPGISTGIPHLWIVATDPTDEDETVIIISITTLRRGAEQTMILKKGEHPFIKRDSSVCYADARLANTHDLDGKAESGQIKMHSSCPSATLEHIKAGILASELAPLKVQRFYESTLHRPQ